MSESQTPDGEGDAPAKGEPEPAEVRQPAVPTAELVAAAAALGARVRAHLAGLER